MKFTFKHIVSCVTESTSQKDAPGAFSLVLRKKLILATTCLVLPVVEYVSDFSHVKSLLNWIDTL